MKRYFSKFLGANRDRLHFAAHSHHPWPDVSHEGHEEAWRDAATLADDKWEKIFKDVVPEAQRHVAQELGLPDSKSLVFAPNTHEFVLRLFSTLPAGATIVTSDGEFHSFERQARRLEEDGLLRVVRVPTEPFVSFPERLAEAARREAAQLVFVSQVFFNSGASVGELPALVEAIDGANPRDAGRGASVGDLSALVEALPRSATIVVDGYHGFLAVPASLRTVASRLFYLAGGYKYAMAGEGACFLHVPEEAEARPRNTGWFAAFGALEDEVSGRVPYAPGGARFMGSTFDPSGLYRFNAVMRWRRDIGLTTESARAHAFALQTRFVEGLRGGELSASQLVVPLSDLTRGRFLTFRTSRAKAIAEALHRRSVIVDARGDRLRFGFGPYQDEKDVDALLARL
jgi:selenocysteine lyase/cysteine desulfurase